MTDIEYEKPSLIDINAKSFGAVCVPGASATDNCTGGGSNNPGSCTGGSSAGGACTQGASASAGDCEVGSSAVGSCTTGTVVAIP